VITAGQAALERPVTAVGDADQQRPPAGPELPHPPDDDEKFGYIHRNLPYLTAMIVIGAGCLIISQIKFEAHNPAPWPFMIFTGTYLIYQVISLPVNFTGAGFDLAAHQERIQAWRPVCYPGVDIYLPICGEPIDMLRNTWSAVSELVIGYPGAAQAYVLDDGRSDEARSVCESLGFGYISRR
jgi:cellulose synthase (UDP-forming)